MRHADDPPIEHHRPHRHAALSGPGARGMPVWATSLVGRDADRGELRRLLLDDGHRLIVITGLGGVGKTRLAASVGAELAGAFADGTTFVPLASVAPGTDPGGAIAWHLGLRDVEGRSYHDSILRELANRTMLLVFDNVDHLPHAISLLRAIEAECAGVAMLVTSRSELDIYGEVIYHVQPLPVAGTGLLPGRQLETARQSPAVRLFLERARAVRPGFSATPDNAAEIISICELLGGLPLAIELTAPSVASRSAATVRAELESGVEPRRDGAPGIHQAMRDTIRLSYDRLDPRAQRAFRTLSIMHGHWTIEDVLPLIADDTGEHDAIAQITLLTTSSMVSTSTGPDEEPRFTMNPMLRAFGRERLATLGEYDEVASRHSHRIVVLAQEVEPQLVGVGQHACLARIDALYDDVRATFTLLLSRGRHGDALQLGASLWRYAYTRGHYREMLDWIARALTGADAPDALRCRALNGAGLLANVIRDPAGARAAHEEALQLATANQLWHEIALSRIGLADIDASFEHDTDSALRQLDLAAEALAHVHDTRALAGVLTNQGNIAWQRGELERAVTMHEEARALYAGASDGRGMAWSDTNIGRIAAQRHRYHEAVPRLHDALAGYLQLGDTYGLAEILEALAAVAVGTGDRDTAAVLAGAATAMRETIGVALKSPDREEFEATLAQARVDPGYRERFAFGSALAVEDAVAVARAIPVPAVDAVNAQALAREQFGLTAREHEVLVLLAEGQTNPQIAEGLRISPRTVQTYLTSILHKLDVTSRIAATRAALRAGLIPPGSHP